MSGDHWFGLDGVRIPDLPAPIRGHRAFILHDGTLKGLRGVTWPTTGALEARHLPDGDPSCTACPSPTADGHGGYGCGIYAFATFNAMAGHSAASDVWAQVDLWGTVYEHAHGVRASHAQLVAVYRTTLDPAFAQELEQVAATYDVPLIDTPLTHDQLTRLTAHQELERPVRDLRSALAGATIAGMAAFGVSASSFARAMQDAQRAAAAAQAHHIAAAQAHHIAAAQAHHIAGVRVRFMQPPRSRWSRVLDALASPWVSTALLGWSGYCTGLFLTRGRPQLAAAYAVIALLNIWNLLTEWRRRRRG